jgi:predicted transcriptional regulator
MALEYENKLNEISKQLKEGVRPQSVTARTFIGWFGAQRRTSWNVYFIRELLNKFQLKTEPDFVYAYIDSPISFVHVPKKKAGQIEEEAIPDVYRDPTYRIGKLTSANRKPLSVNPDDTLAKAILLMIEHDYSQLPSMTSDREVKGIISWSSLGQQLALGSKDCKYVRDCTVPHKEISSDTYIFAAVDDIVANQYVLIRNSEELICGIVTTSDLSQEFRRLGEPFLLLGEIENYIRRMIKDKYTIDDLKEACDLSDATRDIKSPADLTLGEYLRLVENPDRWMKLGVTIDRETFVNKLEEIRRIRNDVMHFDPDGIAEEDIGKLRDFVHLMQSLANVGAI